MFEKVTDHIYVYPFNGYTDRPNIGLIVGEKRALLFEAGNSAAHVELIKKDLEEQKLPQPVPFASVLSMLPANRPW